MSEQVEEAAGQAAREIITVELDGAMSFDLLPHIEAETGEQDALRAALRDTIGEPLVEDFEKAVALALRCVSVTSDGISEPVLPNHRLQAARIFYHVAHAHPEHWERLCTVLERHDS